jgi:WD40 repeat protein
MSVVFDEKEDTIAAGGANGTIKIWEMETGKGEYRCSI